ncbi:MAG: type 4a pilus biogenesis protein PilO [Deltaproteobacteria bacterium]|jgi:type IV pilus assembly protein PilO|nr:type 4a pilus biogenesis protein PilO [Deltaproteobacteria bacterium]
MPKLPSINWRSLGEGLFEKAGKIKRTHRILIFIGTVVLFGGAFYALDYMPKAEEIAHAKDNVDRLEQQLRTVKIRARSLQKFKDEYAKVQEQFNEAAKLLPDKREIPNLLKSISQQGLDAKLEFRLFSPQPEKPKDFYMEIPVSMEVQGEYNNVLDFFDRVGRMDRIVNILNIRMKPDKPLSTKLLTRCTAITYRFKSEEDVKKEQQQKKKK